jgi:hypothetical protein
MLGTLQARLIGAALIAAVAIGGWMYVQGLRSKLETCTTQNLALSLQLTQQNDAIAQLQAAAEKKEADAKAALEVARQETANARRRAQNLFKAKPAIPGDACASALELVNRGAK